MTMATAPHPQHAPAATLRPEDEALQLDAAAARPDGDASAWSAGEATQLDAAARPPGGDVSQHGDDVPLGDGASVSLRPPLRIYCGESSRGCNTRFQQHVVKYKGRKGFMWDHTAEHHGGAQGETPACDYYMKLSSVDRNPIWRIVREPIRIKNAREREDEGGGTAVMNDKSEWFGVKVVSVDFKQE